MKSAIKTLLAAEDKALVAAGAAGASAQDDPASASRQSVSPCRTCRPDFFNQIKLGVETHTPAIAWAILK